MRRGISKFIEENSSEQTDTMSLLWAWKNQPPIMRWWFAFSCVSLFSVYYVLLVKL